MEIRSRISQPNEITRRPTAKQKWTTNNKFFKLWVPSFLEHSTYKFFISLNKLFRRICSISQPRFNSEAVIFIDTWNNIISKFECLYSVCSQLHKHCSMRSRLSAIYNTIQDSTNVLGSLLHSYRPNGRWADVEKLVIQKWKRIEEIKTILSLVVPRNHFVVDFCYFQHVSYFIYLYLSHFIRTDSMQAYYILLCPRIRFNVIKYHSISIPF